MTSKPRLLDLFCGAGGCARGYMDAGFYVVGVDIQAQPRYCGDEFYQEDALVVLDLLLAGACWHGYYLHDFAVIHASPVCKGYTQLNFPGKEMYERLILPVKERLLRSGKVFVIENVSGARLELPGSIMLCGSMFGLAIRRHRLFESNILFFVPNPCQHDRNFYSIHGHHVWNRAKRGPMRKDGRWRPGYGTVDEGKQSMGIDWMQKQGEISQAIPPAYTKWIGQFLMAAIQESEAIA